MKKSEIFRNLRWKRKLGTRNKKKKFLIFTLVKLFTTFFFFFTLLSDKIFFHPNGWKEWIYFLRKKKPKKKKRRREILHAKERQKRLKTNCTFLETNLPLPPPSSPSLSSLYSQLQRLLLLQLFLAGF